MYHVHQCSVPVSISTLPMHLAHRPVRRSERRNEADQAVGVDALLSLASVGRDDSGPADGECDNEPEVRPAVVRICQNEVILTQNRWCRCHSEAGDAQPGWWRRVSPHAQPRHQGVLAAHTYRSHLHNRPWRRTGCRSPALLTHRLLEPGHNCCRAGVQGSGGPLAPAGGRRRPPQQHRMIGCRPLLPAASGRPSAVQSATP